MAEIIDFYEQLNNKPEEELTVREYAALHREELDCMIEELNREYDELAELGRTDPRYRDYTIMKDAVKHAEQIGDKPVEEWSEFEKRLIEKDNLEIARIARKIMMGINP